MRRCGVQNAEKEKEDMQKNDTVVVEITDIGMWRRNRKIDRYTLFIKTAIGDVAEIKVIKCQEKLRICPIDKRA